jgi:Na+/H+ antiporter NhaD/arsenite permease-like protein
MSEEQPKAKESTRNIIIEISRAVTRPAVTVIFAVVIAQIVTERLDAPEWFIALATACILWWFGDRTLQHLKEKK